MSFNNDYTTLVFIPYQSFWPDYASPSKGNNTDRKYKI